MTPNPATSTFEGGQVVANGSPSQQNVYLLDGMYNNDDRLGGSQGTQVRVVLDNIEEYQVLANQYSSEYGGGAGAIINMVTRGGTNQFNGRAYSYFRDETLNARDLFLPDSQPKPPARTLQAGFGLGGPIVQNRAHFYFTYERDNEDIAGQKNFPTAAAPLAVSQVGAFTVRANNYFARGDLQLNDSNFINGRWLLEDAASRGEGFNTNNETPDAKVWEADHDTMWAGTYTSVITDRLSSVTRFGRIGESLTTAPQGFFNDDGEAIGFGGRDPVLDRPAQRARQLHHRHRRHRPDHRHPHLRPRPGVQLLRAAACSAASTPSRRAAATAGTTWTRARPWTRAPSSSAATQATTRPIRSPTRSSSTSSSVQRTTTATPSSRRTSAGISSSRTSGASPTT